MDLSIVKDLDGQPVRGQWTQAGCLYPTALCQYIPWQLQLVFQTIFDSGTLHNPGHWRGFDVAAFAGVIQPRAQRLNLGVLTGDAAGKVLMVNHVGWFDVARPDTCVFGASCGRLCNAETSAYAPPSRPTNYKTPCPPKIQAAMFMTSW